MGTVNGVRVTDARVVDWKHDDDAAVRRVCDARGLVLFDGGGKSDAVVIGGHAMIWERQGERFRAFAVKPSPRITPLVEHTRAVALAFFDAGNHRLGNLLLHQVGAFNALRGEVSR